MKLIIAGTRTIVNFGLIESAFEYFELRNKWKREGLQIVSGGAQGVDMLAVTLATKLKLSFKIFNAKWSEYGRRAGPIRNAEMAEYADELLLIWDGESPGSSNMRQQMLCRNKPTCELIIRDVHG